MTGLDHLTNDLPDPESARRFLSALETEHAADAAKLKRNDGLLSDVLSLASYSPLLATTVLQNPQYLWWLNRERKSPAVRSKEELLESLGRFLLTNSQLDLHAQLARFRRRELLRIFLSDIRRLATMAEITEDISNLADAILETALRRAEQDTRNRFGSPLVIAKKGRKTPAEFCIVSLGKLGSRELNYSSDIDLLFLYSAEGETSGAGSRGSITNREYFTKLSESIVQLVGSQTGEGAAYRVDLRLRPHGRVGPLAISLDDAVRYYIGEARDWERQVLIRSRASAGEASVYKSFFERVEDSVFVSGGANSPPHEGSVPHEPLGGSLDRSKESRDKSVSKSGAKEPPRQRKSMTPLPLKEGNFVTRALENVRRSKQLIDREQKSERGFNVKLGRGGIREIEFIAQALQLAYGGRDRWLRAPHTLISLSRLADRELITEGELTDLYTAYEFLRHLEHILQMENGLQTHTVPDDPLRRGLIARRMGYETMELFDSDLDNRTSTVNATFERVFGSRDTINAVPAESADDAVRDLGPLLPDVCARPRADEGGPVPTSRDAYTADLQDAIQKEIEFRHRLGAFRRRWSKLIGEIRTAELENAIDTRHAKLAQTALAEGSIDTALELTRYELARRYKRKIKNLPIAVIGLGKLGGGAIDYGSDLDLVLVYNDSEEAFTTPPPTTEAEFYSRAAEVFTTTLSSMTRDGSIYRVDLRLRPYGKNGQSVISASAFAEYMLDTAAIWEWLAYVKIRAVGGDLEFARNIETTIRDTIHARAASTDAAELSRETRRVRTLLEKEKVDVRRSKEIDIKYGPGGLLDVYFAMRYLQLRDNVPDRSNDRSTEFMLRTLHEKGSMPDPYYNSILEGYRFLSSLDHNLRLLVGRTTRLPLANTKALDLIARRMQFEDHARLVEQLTLHRITIRKAFEEIVS